MLIDFDNMSKIPVVYCKEPWYRFFVKSNLTIDKVYYVEQHRNYMRIIGQKGHFFTIKNDKNEYQVFRKEYFMVIDCERQYYRDKKLKELGI